MVKSLDVGTAKDDSSAAEMTATTTVDDFCVVELDSVQETTPGTTAAEKTATSAKVGEEAVQPDSVQKTRTWVPTVSRKGRKAIGACILGLAVATVFGTLFGFKMTHSGNNSPLAVSLGDICGSTLYPETCTSTLIGADTRSPKSYVWKSMGVSMTATNETLGNLTRCRDAWPVKTGMQYSTLQMCVDMYEDIMEASGWFLDTVNSVSARGQPDVAVVNDLQQRASAALTYHFTCVSGLQEQGLTQAICGIDSSERMTELLSNALSLVDQFTAANDTAIAAPSRRRLLDVTREERSTDVVRNGRKMFYAMDEGNQERFPAWLSTRDRRLLSNSNSIINVVVALDGSGDYSSIQTAIDRAPSNSSQRYVIHITAGIYHEQLTVPGNKPRLTFVGDGAGVTIITGNMSSSVNNVTTKFTATVTVLGDFFMAKNLTIRNTAGPNGHQAVALRVTSQQSAFTWLSIEGYQETLYAHTSQQFYSYCTIYGTIDYIFGSAAAVFQNCSLLARRPNPGQTITYTASGINSSVVQKHAGLVFHSCLVDATPELTSTQNGSSGAAAVYLGHGMAYARTAFIKSKLGALVDPAGWILWNAPNSSSASHVEYAEYLNFGSGSGFSFRVPWSSQLTPWQALDYGVDKFLRGKLWLPALNVSYSGSI